MAGRERRPEQSIEQASAPAGPVVSAGARRWKRLAGLAAAPLVLLLLVFAADRTLAAGNVLRGVSAAGVSLAGLNRGEVERTVRDLGERFKAQPLRVHVRDRVVELRPEEVGFRIETDTMADAALAAGRSGGWIEQMGFWLARFGSRRDLPAIIDIDGDALGEVLQGWDATVLHDPPFDGAVVVRDGAVVADYPRGGHTIERAAAERLIRQGLARMPHGEIELPLVETKPRLDNAAVDAAVDRARRLLAGPVVLTAAAPPPDPSEGKEESKKDPPEQSSEDAGVRFGVEELSAWLQSRVKEEQGKPGLVLQFDADRVGERIRPLRQRWDHPPEDARLIVDHRDRVTIVPSRMGARLDAQDVAVALLEAASAPDRSGVLPISPGDPPEFSTDAAVALQIEALVSKMTTYHPCCQPRVKNIHRIAAMLDGRIIRPGETFSVNAAVGERTEKNGFVPAPGIEDGEMVDSVGGGVSQFATTLFNAVFYGGYEIIERQAHSYYFSRYPMGHEATLSWPKPDLVFRNDTAAGMLIKTIAASKSITVKIFGNNGGRKVKAKVSGQQDIVKPPVELIPNPRLPPDRAKVQESGTPGWSVIVARVLTFPDGTSKEEKRKVTYKPRVRRVQVHPCRIPKGEKGYTGKPCPEPEKNEEEEEEAQPEGEVETGQPQP